MSEHDWDFEVGAMVRDCSGYNCGKVIARGCRAQPNGGYRIPVYAVECADDDGEPYVLMLDEAETHPKGPGDGALYCGRWPGGVLGPPDLPRKPERFTKY